VNRRALAGTIALLAGSLLFAGVSAELLARLFGRIGGPVGATLAAADPMHVKVVPHGAFGYRQRPGAWFAYPSTGALAHANAEGYRGPVVPVPKPAGTYRIVLLGESTTHGYGVADSETIDTYLRQDLAGKIPASRVEVVNLAFDGYDAYQIRQRLLSDGLPRSPDLVIVNTGINDVRNARYANLHGDPDPRTLLWEDEMRRLREEAAHGGPTLWTRIKHWFYTARIPGLLRQRRATKSTPQAMLRTEVHHEAIDNFAMNVTRIADTLAHLGIPLILSTPPSALVMPGVTIEMDPRSYWVVDAATTQRYRDSLTARLRDIETRGRAAGHPIAYVQHTMAPTMFLDDCHLTADGNRQMAADFAAAVMPFVTRQR
jgi:lysophospholipase L1-like esterase